MRSIAPTAAHLAFRASLEAAIAEHCAHVNAVEMLALVSHMLGQIVAAQDQRTMTNDMAMEIVVANLQRGNSEAVERMQGEGASHVEHH